MVDDQDKPKEDLPSILVVEDDPLMSQLLTTLLNKNYRVESAFEGQEALAKALQVPPDLILVDVMLPGMGGDQLVQEFRRHARFDDVPIIVLTAKADEQLRLSLLSSNVQAYLSKPFEPHELQVWINNLLAQRRRLLEERRSQAARLRSHLENSPLGMIELDAHFRVIYWSHQAEEMFGWMADEVSGKKLEAWNFIHKEDLALFTQMKERLLEGEETRVVYTQRNYHKNGPVLYCQWYNSALLDAAGNPVSILALVHDITRHEQAEAELHLRVRQQAVVAELGLLALQKGSLPTFMDQVVRRVAGTLGVEYCKVLELLPPGEALHLVAGVGWQEGLVGQATVGAGLDSQAGYTLNSEQPVIVWDLREEQRFSGPPLLFDHKVVSGLSVVIGDRQNPYGVLGAHTRQQRRFTADDVNFLQAVANLLAQAINHHRSSEILEARVQERTQALRVVNEQLVQTLEVRRQTEEELRASQELLDSVLNSSPDAIVALDPIRDEAGEIIDFRWALANTKAAELNRLTVDEMVGKRLLEARPGVASSGLLNRYIQVVKTGQPFRGEIFYDYEHIRGWFDLVAVKRGAGLAVTIRDITQQKADQEAIRHLNHILARRAAELERINEELKEFSSSISHDLRAPLRAISGFAQIIHRRYSHNLGEEASHYLNNIIAASNHMDRLIDDLLIYSRLGREPVQPEAVDLATLIQRVRENYNRQIDAMGGSFKLPPEIPPVQGDQTLLRRLFTNLIDNALKYHRPNIPPELVLDYQVDNGSIVVSLQDNGIGIPPEYQNQVFNLFQRLHPLEDYPGTGIGLAIVKRSAQLMNGEVWLQSTPGEGSTFFVSLPLA